MNKPERDSVPYVATDYRNRNDLWTGDGAMVWRLVILASGRIPPAWGAEWRLQVLLMLCLSPTRLRACAGGECRDLSRAAKGGWRRSLAAAQVSLLPPALPWLLVPRGAKQERSCCCWAGARSSHSLLVLRPGLPVMFLRENISWQCKDFFKICHNSGFWKLEKLNSCFIYFWPFFACPSFHFVPFCIENYFFWETSEDLSLCQQIIGFIPERKCCVVSSYQPSSCEWKSPRMETLCSE